MINRSKLKPIFAIHNNEVKKLAKEAEMFLLSHHWCRTIEYGYLSWAVAGVIGVFLFDIIPSEPEVDKTLWVVTGDIPSAYLVTDEAETWQEALEAYVYEMNRWVEAVRAGKSLDDIIPVNVEPDLKYAEMLEGRLSFMKKNFINTIEPVEGDSYPGSQGDSKGRAAKENYALAQYLSFSKVGGNSCGS
jgi:hypothetical protein